MSEVDYKDTINLPQTSFPMRANLPQREPEILKKWQHLDLYKKIRTQQQGKEKYVLNDGPPYANGDIHIGHAVNKILKDMVVKAQTLSDKDAPFVPGWDCHGLPIELNVEKAKGKPNVDLTPAAFRQACREYADSQVNVQRESFKRLGVIADWDNPYKTMDYQYQADIMRAFGQIYQNGHVQQGVKPVHWCTQCGSALAEAEVEHQDKTSEAIDVCFKVKDTQAFLEKIGADKNIETAAVVIWTTTPWTLPANQAVAFNPELEYVIVKASLDGVPFDAFIMIESLLESCMSRYGCKEYSIVHKFKGQMAEHVLLEHPFYERDVPILLGEHVTTEAGTGAVHTAPAHGMDDYHLGIKYGLVLDGPVDDNGKYYASTPFLGGVHVFKANEQVIALLKEKNRLLHDEKLSHSYPHCWRHKTPLIFRATQQWFISMDEAKLRQTALEQIKQVNWIPEWGESRISLMIEGRPDWCISRQRTWGVPIPLFTHKETKAVHPDIAAIIEYVAQRVEQEGIEAWHTLDIASLPFKDMSDYQKSRDSLDVWFDSGVSHVSVLKRRKELQYPAQLFLEGSDQHRGWFQSSLLSAVAIDGKAPYESVLTHGFTVDQLGRKMSKSLGNVVAPDKVIKALGADVLRLWVAATDYKGELHVSDEILKRTSDAYRRIRNTARFLLGNLSGFSHQHQIQFDEMLALDKWIVDRAYYIQEDIIKAFEECQFHTVYQKIHNFCVLELGSFYLDVIKDRQYTLRENSHARRSAQSAMYHVVHALVKWMAPILSFTAEEIWEILPDATTESVFLSTWHNALRPLPAESTFNNDFWQKMIAIRDAVNKAIESERAKGAFGAGLEAEIILYADDAFYPLLAKLEDELRFLLITSKADLQPLSQKPDHALETEIAGLAVTIAASSHPKCKRCWHRREDVNKNPDFPEICGRCVENIDTHQQGEKRMYA